MTLDDLKSRHSALLAARYSGTRSVSYDGKTLTYGTDAELAAADLRHRTAHRKGRARHWAHLSPPCRKGPVMNWRQRLGAFVGGFDAGQHHRRLRGFQATRAHVNALIAASGPDITARARWLVRNNGYAANAVESWAANTVGDGIKPISQIADAARKEELQRLWLAWTDEADAKA